MNPRKVTDDSKHRIILVTGAASGIGKAVAQYLTQRRYYVLACDIDSCPESDYLEYFPLDITNSTQIVSTLEKIAGKYRYLDGIVNCAGIVKAGPLVELDVNDLQEIFTVNVFGMFELTKA